jgi:diguanylate cyclase (GGDEF)-like protein
VLEPPRRPPSGLSGEGDGRRRGPILVVIHTKEAGLLGRRIELDPGPVLVGSSAENHVVLRDANVAPRHAHFEAHDAAWWYVDDGSVNGSYVNDERITREARLGDGDRIKIGATIFKFLSGQDLEARYHEEIYRLTIIDGLTQVHVKRYLLESLDKETMRARRHAHDLSLLMLDIDHLKKINDVHGHMAGDQVLKEIARLLQQRIKRDEVLARYGGEEFAVVLPQTHLEGARALAEGLREKIEKSRFVFRGEIIGVTVSIGGSILQEGDRGSLDLIKRADEKLHEAKRAGRNRVLV